MSRLVYVFTSTNWQNINLAPALELGEIDRFLVLICARGGRYAKDDEVHAETSIKRFAKAFELEMKHIQRHRTPELLLIQGPLESVAFWRREVTAKLANSDTGAPTGGTVVLNYLAGPSDAKIGAWLGLDDLRDRRPDLTIRRLSYSADSRLLWREADDAETTAPMTRSIGLPGWLALRGRLEKPENAKKRHSRERAAHKSRDCTNYLARACFSHPRLPVGWMVELLSFLAPHGRKQDLQELAARNDSLASLEQSELEGAIRELVAEIDGMSRRFPGARGEGTTIHGNIGLMSWLKSQWFEEFAYLGLCERIGRERVMLNVELDMYDPDNAEIEAIPGFAAPELEVVAVGRNQLHVIECKAFRPRTKSQARQKWIDQCARIRSDVVGPGGLVFGFSTAPLPKGSLTRRFAVQRGVGLAATAQEIETALDQIAEACR